MFKDMDKDLLVLGGAIAVSALVAGIAMLFTFGSGTRKETLFIEVPRKIFGFTVTDRIPVEHTWAYDNGVKIHTLYYVNDDIEAYVDNYSDLSEAIDIMVSILKK